MSAISSATLPKLRQAKFKNLNFKSGATFEGSIEDHKRSGQGIFSWPNGARYEGSYSNNQRHGKGLQIWQDGSSYEGDFNNDMRHGQGKLTWSNGESYEGTFYKDRRHGTGTYTWPDGSTYKGTFYMDKKEGYAMFKFANGNTFEGLYKEDERFGPGVLTYGDGAHDAGLWHREKLTKFCSDTEGAFSMKDHKEFDYNPEEHIHYINLDFDEKPSVDEVIKSPDIFDYLPESKITDRVSDLYNESLDPRSLAVNKETFDKEFFKNVSEEKNDKDEKVAAWNKTPSIITMQRHVHKHRHNQKSMSYSVDKILKGDRSGFKKKGPLEQASEELIEAATKGDVKKVEDLLAAGKVHPDVADKNGHTALIGATFNWHMDVINCLLNQGVNINKLNDEGCSALSVAAIYYYPVDGFRYNIAERYLERPPPAVQETKDKKVVTKPKGILNKKQSSSNIRANQTSVVIKPKPNELSGQKPKVTATVSGQSIVSADSGFQQTDSNQSIGSTKPQVRIVDPMDNNVSNVGPVGTVSEVEYSVQDQVVKEEKPEPDNFEFESTASLRDFEIQVSDQLLERCATQLSTNEKIVGGRRSSNSMDLGTVRHLAVIKKEKERMKSTIDLLLKRGADPNSSGVPMPILFFAIKSADVEVVKVLLLRGASTAITLPKEKGGLAPLHIAAAIPGDEGVKITELLLNALADPDVRATEDDSFLNRGLEDEWSKDAILPASLELLGGRTPLQIACARDDNYKNACRITRLLLEHKANTSLLCNGFSALALAIASGNDLCVDELLVFGNDPSLSLTHGVGSALCAAASTDYEHRRPINGRLQLIDKLVKAGANILAPIPIGPKRIIGTAVDFAYHMFNKDRRIGRTPYHALTHAERETFNDRQKLLAHIGNILRTKAVERERRRLDDEISQGRRSRSPSPNFVYIGAGAELPPDAKLPKSLKMDPNAESRVTFDAAAKGASTGGKGYPQREPDTLPASLEFIHHLHGSSSSLQSSFHWSPMKPIFKYCYECGRSVGVRLSACTRCKEVYYCSKNCKLNAWNARHKEECVRVGARSRSPSPVGRRGAESPTLATGAKSKKFMASDLSKNKASVRINYQMTRSHTDTQLLGRKNSYFNQGPMNGYSKSAFGTRRKLTEEDILRATGGRHWSPPPGVVILNYSHV